MPTISVIICTHNPRPAPLRRTLECLRKQTLPFGEWECVLVDNASAEPLAEEAHLAGLPNGKIVLEPKLGLTPARVRGFKESSGQLIVYVDDDNVLAPDFLSRAKAIFDQRPYIGAFGGSITPVFEQAPPEWTQPYWYLLAVRDTPEDRWGNTPGHAEAEPCGAGLCVRREVASRYVQLVEKDPIRALLDRRGDSLASAGDTDLIHCSFDLGLGVGRFKALQLDHLIPLGRLEPTYLLRLFEAMHHSGELLKRVRGRAAREFEREQTLLGRCVQKLRYLRMSSFDRKMADAAKRGTRRALVDWAKLETDGKINSLR